MDIFSNSLCHVNGPTVLRGALAMRLDRKGHEANATSLGTMLITQIQLPAMSRVHMPESQQPDFFLYVDDFQNFAPESFVKILSEVRKYRLDLMLANQ